MDLIEQKQIASPKFIRHPWERARFEILSFFLTKKPSKNFIVDVGSGDAFVSRALSKQFPHTKLAAVDINYDTQFIRENTASNLMLLKSIKEVPSNETIDVVLLMDVLEHLENPEQLLHNIRQLNISPSTQFIITVPAFQSLFSQHDIFLKHYRRYTVKQLRELLRKEGFKIAHSGYFFTSLWVARSVQKVFATRSAHGLHNWGGNAFTTSVFTNLLWIDFKISWYLSRIGISLPGLSCYCICHPLPS